MIIQISRFSSSALLLPSSDPGALVVVVAWAPSVPLPGTSRLATVVNVMPWASARSAAATSSTWPSSATTSSAPPGSAAVSSGCPALVCGAVACVLGVAVVGGSVVGGFLVVGVEVVVVSSGGGAVVGVVGGPGSGEARPRAADGSPTRTSSASNSLATRRNAGRPPRDGLPALMYSHLAGPQPGDRTCACRLDGWTLHLSK
jgi:hypothetical protein